MNPGWIFIFVFLAAVVAIIWARRSKSGQEYLRQPHEVDLETLGHNIPLTGATWGNPGDPQMVRRIEKKLKEEGRQ
jgi:hypothetical protein